MAVALPAAYGENRCQQADLALQVLGSGGPEFYSDRASTSYLIWRKGEAVVMVDAGSGSKFRFAQSGADFNTVDAILFTHLHVDHSADLPGYIKSAFFSDRNRTLAIYGPEGDQTAFPSTHDFVNALFGEKHAAYTYLNRYLSGGDEFIIQIKDIKTDKHEIQDVETRSGIKLSAIPVHHGPVPAVAWRIDVDNKSIVFSGDMNGDYKTMEILAKNADLFVAHNAVAENAKGVERNLHMPPSVIAEIAQKANVKQLVLSHRMHRTLGQEQQNLTIIQKTYKHSVLFANDLDCFVP